MWGMAPRRGKLSPLLQALAAMGGAWLKKAGGPGPFTLPVGLCQSCGGKGLLWVLSSLDWQADAEDRAGCGQKRGPKTAQSEGCMTCWLCLARMGEQRTAQCCCFVSFGCLPWLCHRQSRLTQGLPTDFA